MGQYYQIYNADKKEKFDPEELGSGSKLAEQIYQGGSLVALFLLLTNSNDDNGGDIYPPHPCFGRWAGDRVVVQGDYATPLCQGFVNVNEAATIPPYEDFDDGFIDITKDVKNMLEFFEKWYEEDTKRQLGFIKYRRVDFCFMKRVEHEVKLEALSKPHRSNQTLFD